MKKVLYLSNIEVPYRVRFFNELARHCDLTVVYERENSSNRNSQWAKSEEKNYQVRYLNGIKIKGESQFSFGVLREVFAKWDAIIVGCYNSPVQMLAILAMRLFRIPYMINLDGETFLKGNGMKTMLKKAFLKGAKTYLVAGKTAAQSVKEALGPVETVPYSFSSLSDQELQAHEQVSAHCERNDTILVVGQYFDYKGMDIALKAADMDLSLRYKFVGMGKRTELFCNDFAGKIPKNVEVIPFLQKEELELEYQRCGMLVLPSRQECWGLVINEAASFGMPIVATWGSGAAVEFLAEEYPAYLAEPDNAENLYRCICNLAESEEKMTYGQFLIRKSREYSIEKMVQEHLEAFGV